MGLFTTKKPNPSSSPVLSVEDVEEIPRLDGEDTAREHKRNVRIKALTWFVILAFPLSLLATLYLVVEKVNTPPVELPQQVTLDPPGKDVATETVRSWLDGKVPPIVAGTILSWDGAVQVANAEKDQASQQGMSQVQGGITDANVWVHNFSLVDGAGVFYDASVQIAVTDATGASAVGTPSLIPRLPGSQISGGNDNPWPQLQQQPASPSEPVKQAVGEWLNAYTSGNANRLRLSTGDPNESNTYMPLVGVKTNSLRFGAGVGMWGNTRPEDPQQRPPRMLLRIDFQMIQESTLASVSGKGNDTINTNDWPVITMDIIVDAADTGSPRVVAWGGPGSGPDLQPYGNAVADRKVALEPSSPATQAPDAEETAQPSNNTGE